MKVSSLLVPCTRRLYRKSHASALLIILFFTTITPPFISHAALQGRLAGATGDGQRQMLPNYVPGEILVRFRAGAKGAQIESGEQTLVINGLDTNLQIERFAGSDIVEGLRLAHVSSIETFGAIAALKSRADVLYAEPNYIRQPDDLPDDPSFSQLYALKNTGQFGGTVGADIHAEQAWNITHGSRNVVVAIIDTGIDINHPDLRENIWVNPGETGIDSNGHDKATNGMDDDGDGLVDDVNGWDFFDSDNTVFDGAFDVTNKTDSHGTHVAGIIGAVGNNGVGVAGVNWQTSIMPLKVLGPNGGSDATILKAYAHVKKLRDAWVNSNGAKGTNVRVINNSFGGGAFSQSLLDGINELKASGVLLVAGAGNNSASTDIFPHYPASFDSENIISVAATDSSDRLAFFSDFGPTTV